MPKVLRIINRFNLGGITYNVSYLSKYLPEEYETVLIGGPEEKGEESSLYIPNSLGLQPRIISQLRRSINPLNDYYALREIKKIIKEFKPDIVHTHASKAGVVGRLAAIQCKVPVIVHTFHGHVFKGYFNRIITAVFKQIERYFARKSTAIISISNIQKQEICETHSICDFNKTFVIPLGFDLKRFTENKEEKRKMFREKYGLKADDLAIGIIGRLAPIKNHSLFIDSIEYVKKSTNKSIKAFIIGDGEIKEELMTYVNQKQLKYSVNDANNNDFIFTSWIKEVDVALAGLDMVCLTSINEGTPVSLIEAQAASKYIVSTNVGGVKDILNPNCGVLSAAGDAEGFKQNLLSAILNFEKLQSQAGLASQEVLQKFSYTRLCNDMFQLYNQLLKK